MILVILTKAPEISESSGLYAWTDFHSPLSPEREELYASRDIGPSLVRADICHFTAVMKSTMAKRATEGCC